LHFSWIERVIADGVRIAHAEENEAKLRFRPIDSAIPETIPASSE